MADRTTYRYWAFISYSNRDKSWARWLHRAIETYGIPARLVSHPTPTGEPAPKRLRPLFHDRAELPASSDLGTQIEDALRASRFLIVICSPHAARSEWVNKEIETFLRMGRPGRVLAVIVDGEPNVGDERECLPSALRQAEPIAADARREGDGRGNAKLKLLAGMLGVGFDGLKQRDTHRRIRRLQFAIGLASILAVGFAGLASYASQQRDRAVRARMQAESILEYLLYDLRDKLEPVGRLDIVEDVQRKVDAYYQELAPEKGDPNTLRNRAAAYDNVGDRLMAQGALGKARKVYGAALAICEQLVAADPTNGPWQKDLFVSRTKIGDVLQAGGDLAGAVQAYRQGLEVVERLAAAYPTNGGWQRDLSAANNKIGDVMLAQRDVAGALRAYREGLEVIERLAAAHPTNGDWQSDLSASHSRIGQALQAQGDLVGAQQAYQASFSICQRLAAADPKHARWQRAVCVSHEKIGNVLEAKGDLAGALREYQTSSQGFERLASSDPTNAGWQRDVLISYVRLAVIREKEGQVDAMAWWRRAYEKGADMRRRGLMQPRDEKYLALLNRKVGG